MSLLLAAALATHMVCALPASGSIGIRPDRPHRDQLTVAMLRGSQDSRWALVRAINTINSVARTSFLKFVKGPDADVTVRMVKNITEEGYQDAVGLCTMTYFFWTADIQVITGLTNKDRVDVLTHELIHALGIKHSDNSNSLMFWKTPDRPNSQILLDEDVLNIRSAIEDFKAVN